MERSFRSLLAAGFVVASAIVFQSPAAADDAREIVPDEVLVGMSPSRDSVQAGRFLASIVGVEFGYHQRLHVHRLKLRPGLSVDRAIALLNKRTGVLYVEPNGVYHACATPNDTSYASLQYGPQKVQADLAWGIWQPKAQIIVGIIDTGIDYTHPDLTNKILRDGSGNVIGHNSVGSNAHSGNGTDPADDYGHGTHCAGIAGAQINNATGVAGIAGWNGQAGSSDTFYTKLMPVKVLDSTGSGSDATVADGITWAADHGAKVISLSLGGGGSTTLSNSVSYAWGKGCVIVAAAGNSGSSALSYPGAYPNVISVAATDRSDKLTYYSNYGSWVVVAAPGGGNIASDNIYSTLPTYANQIGTNYGGISGTSMATPHVAGEAALIWAHAPSLTNSQLRSLIMSNVDPYTPYNTHTIASGAGRINVYRALQAATGPTIPAPPTNLVATAGNGQASLTWNASTGATSYNVKRSTVSGGPYTGVGSTSSTSFTNTGLTNGTAYYFVVTASNSAGESGNSNQASATPTSVTAQQLLVNPGFENGTNAAPWVATSGVINNSSAEPPHSGSWDAWMDGYGFSHTDTLYQQVTIPSAATSATLTFWLHIDTRETTTSIAYDKLQVQIRNSSGTLLATLATYSNLNRAFGYSQKSFDISAYKGQTIRVYLTATEDSSLQTSFVVDDLALNVQ